jgi:hypothetical protein
MLRNTARIDLNNKLSNLSLRRSSNIDYLLTAIAILECQFHFFQHEVTSKQRPLAKNTLKFGTLIQ